CLQLLQNLRSRLEWSPLEESERSSSVAITYFGSGSQGVIVRIELVEFIITFVPNISHEIGICIEVGENDVPSSLILFGKASLIHAALIRMRMYLSDQD